MRIHERTPRQSICSIIIERRLEQSTGRKAASVGTLSGSVPLFHLFHIRSRFCQRAATRIPPRAHVTMEQLCCLSNGGGCSIMCSIAMERWNKRWGLLFRW